LSLYHAQNGYFTTIVGDDVRMMTDTQKTSS
jgi:hypothetical protein